MTLKYDKFFSLYIYTVYIYQIFTCLSKLLHTEFKFCIRIRILNIKICKKKIWLAMKETKVRENSMKIRLKELFYKKNYLQIYFN